MSDSAPSTPADDESRAAPAGPALAALAPLPPAAAGPVIPPSGAYVEEVGKDVYYVTDGLYQAMFLVHDGGVAVVDTPSTMATTLLPAIRQVTERPITHLVYSHNHRDHIGAAGAVVGAAREEHPSTRLEVVAHAETARLIGREWPSVTEVGGPRPAPTQTFIDSTVLRLGRYELHLAHHGPNHSADNIFVYAPEQKVLMLVDVLWPGWTPFKDLAFAQDVPGFYRAHDQALDYPFDKVVTGHVARVGDRADVLTQREYVHEMLEETRRAYGEVDPADVAARLGTDNPWAVFSAYYDEIARIAADRVVPRWVDRLGAVDVLTTDHIVALAISLRLD